MTEFKRLNFSDYPIVICNSEHSYVSTYEKPLTIFHEDVTHNEDGSVICKWCGFKY